MPSGRGEVRGTHDAVDGGDVVDAVVVAGRLPSDDDAAARTLPPHDVQLDGVLPAGNLLHPPVQGVLNGETANQVQPQRGDGKTSKDLGKKTQVLKER